MCTLSRGNLTTSTANNANQNIARADGPENPMCEMRARRGFLDRDLHKLIIPVQPPTAWASQPLFARQRIRRSLSGFLGSCLTLPLLQKTRNIACQMGINNYNPSTCCSHKIYSPCLAHSIPSAGSPGRTTNSPGSGADSISSSGPGRFRPRPPPSSAPLQG